MPADERIVLVFEPQPNLTQFLDDQIEGWTTRHCEPGLVPTDAHDASAAVMAGLFDHWHMARALRQALLIGPLFSVGEAGQDAKPPLTVLARPLRLNAMLNRLKEQADNDVDLIPLGRWCLDITQKALVDPISGEVERLTERELALMAMLIRLSPCTLSREDLQTQLWGYHNETTSHTVETHVWRLRQKLEANPAEPTHLLTTGDGYCLKLGEP